MDVKGLLTKKYGGLPVWAWGLVAVGGIGVGLYFYNRNKTASATATPTGATTDTTGTTDASVGTTGYGDYSALGPNAGESGTGTTTININPTNPANLLQTLILTSNGPVPLYATYGTPGDLTGTSLGQPIAQVPSGSTIQATGPEVTGAYLPPGNSEMWYPVVYQGQAGYINSHFVANSSGTITGSPVTFPVPNPPPVPVQPTGVASVTVKIAGQLADKPGGTNNGGKNLASLSVGEQGSLLSNTPTTWNGTKYYNVQFNGVTGWVRNTTIGK